MIPEKRVWKKGPEQLSREALLFQIVEMWIKKGYEKPSGLSGIFPRESPR